MASPLTTASAAAAPVAPDVARQAVHWLLTLQSDASSDAQRRRHLEGLRSWLAQDAAHARAWERIAEVDDHLRSLDTQLAMRTLAGPHSNRRRAVQLAVLLTAGAGGLLAVRQSGVWTQWSADLATATGERRDAVLPDGTRLALNTASAVDVRFSSTERLLLLRAGEILVETAADPLATASVEARPFRVRTTEGTVRAIGTRFTVRQREGRSDVAVLQGAVELQPTDAPQDTRRLQAGTQGHFTRSTSLADGPLREADSAWRKGMLVVDDMRLADFLAELARYRSGLLRCAQDAAELRVSGSYPLTDTDRVLAALTLSLPVEVELRTRWWVTVRRRDTSTS